MPDGSIDRHAMAERIFRDETLLSAVNGLVHPAVRAYILRQIDEERQRGSVDFFFLEAALLIECGYDAIVDEILSSGQRWKEAEFLCTYGMANVYYLWE
jgi:dephospho-CoA kinase